jgi:hypothetical protein
MTFTTSISPGRYSSEAVTSNLSIPEHDYVSCSYTGTNLTGAVFKVGGASGDIVATLILTYDGSNNLLTVTRS